MKADKPPYRPVADSDIIEMLTERDERGIVEMQNKFGSFLQFIAFNVLRDRLDAEECVNDAFSAAWNTIPPEKPSRLGAYLARLARNTALKRLREKNAQKRGGSQTPVPLDELAECIPGDPDAEAGLETAELTKAIEAFLSSLPKDERVIFVRRYWYLDRVSDIAYRMGFTESKVKMTLSRTREKLRLRLVEEGIFI